MSVTLSFNDIFSEIKSTVSLVTEMEKHGISLMRAGPTRLKCVCPFHSDGDPSLVVYLESDDGYESWCCFGCRVGGDVINFVKKAKGINTSQAIKYFSENYPLRLASNIDFKTAMRLSTEAKKSPKILRLNSIIISHHIQEWLRESNNPIQTLMVLKPYLRELDSAVNDSDEFMFFILKNDIFKAIKDMREKIKKELK